VRIRTRLFLLLLVLTLVPLGLLGVLSYRVARTSVEGKVAEQLTKVRDEISSDVQASMMRIEGVIDELTRDRNFELYLRYTGKKDVSILEEIIQRTFEYHLSKDDRFLGVIVDFPSGDRLVILKPGLDLRPSNQSGGISLVGENAVAITRRIERGGVPPSAALPGAASGTIHFYVRPEILMDRVRSASIGRDRPVDGFLILGDRLFAPDRSVNEPVLGTDWRNGSWLTWPGRVAAVGPIEDLPDVSAGTIYAGASMPEEAYLAPVRRVRTISALIMLLAAALALFASLFFATTIVRPIRAMVGLTRRLADGDLAARLSETRGDEIGDLARDFNAMGEKLEESQTRIEERNAALMREQARVDLAVNMCRNVLSARGFEAQVQAVCEEIRKHFGIARVAVYLVNDEGTRIEGVAAAGFLAAFVRGQDYPVEDRPGDESYRAIARAASRGERVVFRRDRAENAGPAANETEESRMEHEEYACFPLRSYNRTLGVVAVFVRPGGGILGEEMIATIEAFADLVSLAILEAKTTAEAREAYLEVLTALAGVIEKRDAYTGLHTENVLAYSTALARAAGQTEDEIEGIRIGAILHDIGKIGIADSSLQKKGALTPQELEEMKRHPLIGFDILSGSRFLRASREIVRHHHERWDGTGYPDRLKGAEIPIAAQIVAIADAYDAMVTDRPYRNGMSTADAIKRIKEGAGSQFNPYLVDLFIEAMGLEGGDKAHELESREEGTVLQCRVSGCLTLDAGRELAERADQWLTSRGRGVVIDMKEVKRLTDGGIWVLLRTSWRCRAVDGLMVLVCEGEVRERILALSADFPFRIVRDIETAARLVRSRQVG
jgi:HD-GYP domain-containing protein (c-di-GMP phosphodiesterase class II)/HAMP domain-containing protein